MNRIDYFCTKSNQCQSIQITNNMNIKHYLMTGLMTISTLLAGAQTDVTSKINNPSFESGFTGWTQKGMQTQTNDVFSIKSGITYAEKWVERGGAVGDALLTQTVTNLTLGTYQLTVAAQNIQENTPNASQTGAWVFANGMQTAVSVRKNYTVEFTVLDRTAAIGFKADGATGNWIACDNFRLTLLDDSFEAVKAGLEKLIEEAKSLAEEKMDADVLAKLQEATQEAEGLLDATDETGFARVGKALQTAIEEARESVEITAFADKIANGTGNKPTVTTDKRYARGATMAFGRMTVSGTDIMEQGFCYSTEKEPTVLDSRATEFLYNNGRIYWLKDLTPATVYYMRPYAITTTYAVGYGDPIKVITLPKGKINWSYGYEGDADINNRIVSAIETAYGYWENLTQLTGFTPSIHYASGTPTADCSYGGWMRVGPLASYQAPGTIMHESNHGTGGGTHERWWNTNLHNGAWFGPRANAALRFWDNDNNAYMSGDSQHMWPYGINGASEDNHTDVLYIGNSIISEGLWEDGLPPTSSAGVALPAYAFEHDDDVKYYIKNEDSSRGFYNAFLVENESGQLVWKEMTATQAKEEESNAAWYISFTPSNQYYQFRNAATGHYISYTGTGNNGFKALAKDNPSFNENLHLMQGRENVVAGSGQNTFTTLGYWVIHHTTELDPPTFTANTNGITGAATFDISNAATTQRWVILTEEEASKLELAAVSTYKKEYTDFVKELKKLVATPHTEDVEGIDQKVNETITRLEEQSATATTADVVFQLVSEVKAAGMEFLASTTPADVAQPFDITFLMNNPAIDDNSGWSLAPTFDFSCCEFFQTTFDFYQTLAAMPKGTYKLTSQAFQRPGTAAEAYTAFSNGRDAITTFLYLNTKTVKVKNIAAEAQTSRVGGDELTVGSPVMYVPNNMEAASKYFAKGLYQNEVMIQLFRNSDLKLGLRCASSRDSFWTIFDNFHLYYYGSLTQQEVTGIHGISYSDTPLQESADVYNMNGQLVRKAGQGLDGLQKGIYIINGKKVLVK